MKITTSHSIHTFDVRPIAAADLPAEVKGNENASKFSKFYAVRNFDQNGHCFMYLAKGHENAPNQVCVFYRSGQFWTSYGKNMKLAIEGAQKDGWLYA